MLIIWHGFGLLVLVIALASALMCNFACDAVFGSGYYSAHRWTAGVALFVAAGGCWFLGDHLRRQKPKVVIDKQTGRELVLQKRHALFFIPMHLWGPIFLVIGFVLCVMELFR